MSSAEIAAQKNLTASKTQPIKVNKLPTSAELDDATAQLVISQLRNPRITTFLVTQISPRALERKECLNLLAKYFRNNFANLETYLPDKFRKPTIVDSKEFFETLNIAVGDLIGTKAQQEQLGQAVVPTQEVLLQWAQERAAWEALKINAETRTGPLSQYGDLKTQLERVQKFQWQLEQMSAAHLAEFLAPEERKEVLSLVSDKIIKQVATQRTVDQNATTWALQDLYDENPLVAAALSKQAIEKLSKQVALLNSAEVQRIAQDQAALNEAAIAIAPTRKELVGQIEATFGVSNQKAKEFVDRIEATAGPNHTRAEMQALFVKNLSLGDRITLSRHGKTPEQVAQELCLAAGHYVTALPLAQPNAQYAEPLPITKDAQRWAKVLAAQGLDVDHAVIENALRGVTSSQVDYQIKLLAQRQLALQKAKQGFAYTEAKIKRLTELNNQMQAFEKQLALLPNNLRRRINLAKISPSLRDFLTRVNPLDWGFWQTRTPTLTASIDARVMAIDNYIRNLEKKPVIGLFLNPGYHYALQMRRNQLFWAKLVRRNVSNRGLQRFIYFLPNRLLPSYWLRPVYWARRGTSKALMWAGKKLGKSALGFALRKAGVELAKFTFKELFKKGLLALLGSAAAGPIGTAISIAYTALSWGYQAIKFAFSPQGKYLIKKVLGSAAKALGGLLLGLYYLLAKFPLMLMGSGIGFTIAAPFGLGPIGFFAGGTLGYMADSLISSLGGLGNAASGLAQGLGEALSLPNLAAGLTSTGSALAITSVVSIGSPIIAVGAMAYLNHGATNAAYVLPDKYTVAETETEQQSQYFSVTKTADKNDFQNSDLDNNPTITYTVTITAKDKNIVVQTIEDKFSINIESASPSLPQPTIPDNISAIKAGDSTTYSYQVNLNPAYKDSSLMNSLTVTSNIEDGPEGEISSASQSINIGTPPGLLCNSGQGTKYCFPIVPVGRANYANEHHDYPAADIFACGSNCSSGNIDNKGGPEDDVHLTIVAYVGGQVLWTDNTPDIVKVNGQWMATDKSGVSVGIAGQDGRYYYYGHMDQLASGLSKGDQVAAGQPIGTTDSSGNAVTTPEHLHIHISKVADLHESVSAGSFIWPQKDFQEKLGMSTVHLCDCQKK